MTLERGEPLSIGSAPLSFRGQLALPPRPLRIHVTLAYSKIQFLGLLNVQLEQFYAPLTCSQGLPRLFHGRVAQVKLAIHHNGASTRITVHSRIEATA